MTRYKDLTIDAKTGRKQPWQRRCLNRTFVLFTEHQIQSVVERTSQKLESIYKNITAVSKEVQKQLNQTVQDVSVFLTSYSCFKALGIFLASKISNIKVDALSEGSSLKSFKEEVLPYLVSIAESAVRSAESQGPDIAQDIIKCIKDKTSAADSTSTAQWFHCPFSLLSII